MTLIAQLLGGRPQAGQIVAPKTPNELAALIERRDEIQDQLEDAGEARAELAQHISQLGVNDPLREGPMARLRGMDDEITKLSRDLRTSNDLITAAKASGLSTDNASTEVIHIPPIPRIQVGGFPGVREQSWQDRIGPVLATTVPITLASVVLLGALLYWRISRSVRNQLTKILGAQSGRLDELQRSVDTVAVELERVSENQRYVTKLVGDKSPAQVPERR